MLSALKSLFKQEIAAPYESIAVDMHSHVLPGLDDGSDTLEQSLEMLAVFKKLGFRKLIMTPHIMGDFYKNTPAGIKEKLSLLKAAAQEAGLDLELECAAEYYLDEWFLKKIAAPEPLLTFGDNYVLFETSYINEPLNFREAIFAMKSMGYKPVLAHPERYTYFYGRFEELLKIYDLGVLFQININSLSGYYSEGARKVAEKLIDQGMVQFIGTDAHHNRHLFTLQKVASVSYFKKALALPLRNKQL